MQSWQHWSYLYPQKRQSHHSFPLGSQILWIEAERPPSLSSLWWPHSRGHSRSLWPFLDWMWSMCGKWWPLGSPSVSLVMDGKRSLLLATRKIRKYISVSESSFISVAPYYVHGTVKGKLEESFLFRLLPVTSNGTTFGVPRSVFYNDSLKSSLSEHNLLLDNGWASWFEIFFQYSLTTFDTILLQLDDRNWKSFQSSLLF